MWASRRRKDRFYHLSNWRLTSIGLHLLNSWSHLKSQKNSHLCLLFVLILQMLRRLRTSDVLKQLGFAGVTRSSEDLQMCPLGQSPGSAWGRPCSHSLCGSRWGGHTCSHCPPPQGQAEEDRCLHTSFTRNLLASGAVTAAQGWPRCPLQAVIRAQQGPAAEHPDAHDAGRRVCHFSPQVPPDHCRLAVSAV